MRYCYARLLSVGNPSGPVKFSGQPQYDSEQVVSPLFTFSAPPMEEEGGEEEGSADAAERQVRGGVSLAARNTEVMQPLTQQAQYQYQQPVQQLAQQQPAAAPAPQQLQAKALLPPPTAIVQPEPQGGARIIEPVKLTGEARANPQSEWAAFEAVQKAGKQQWLQAQQQARAQKAQVHAAAQAKMAAQGLLPRLNALPKMRAAQGRSQLAQTGPWFNHEQALAI